jgi:hypothetical protein
MTPRICRHCHHYADPTAPVSICGGIPPRAEFAGFREIDGEHVPITITLRPEVAASEPACVLFRWRCEAEGPAVEPPREATEDAPKAVPIAGQQGLWACIEPECSGVTEVEGGRCGDCDPRYRIEEVDESC